MQNEIMVPDPGRREQALERSQKVSRALHDAARKARQTVRGSNAWQPGFSRGNRGNRKFAIGSLFAICVIPTLLVAAYFGLIASDQYSVEARFSVRGRELSQIDKLGSMTGLPALQQSQDSLLVVDYVQSRGIVERLEKEIDLRSLYSRPQIDWWFRFDPTESIEQFVRYWRKRITVEVEFPSGIVALYVRAFTAADALRIGNAVLNASEELVNDLSNRSRRDALRKAGEEVDRAEQRLSTIRAQFRELRDNVRLIDARKAGEEVSKLLSDLKLERIRVDSELQVNASRNITSDAPQVRNLRARTQAVSAQIASLESTLTTAGSGVNGTVAEALTRFDKVRLDQEWAEKFYETVAGSLEKARTDLDRQQVYLEAFVKPVLPEEAEFPRRRWLTFLFALASFATWFLLNYLRTMLRG